MGPLSINLAEVKTSVPLIKDGATVELRLDEIEAKEGEKGTTLQWKWSITHPVADTEGGTITPGALGSKVFDSIQLYSKPDSKDPLWFAKRIASRVDALLGTGDQPNPKGKPARPQFDNSLIPQLIGKTIVAKMKVRTGDYTGNELGSVFHPADIKQA